MATIYKCPQCGSNMLFDAVSGMLQCEHCACQIPVEEYQEKDEKRETDAFSEGSEKQYHCPSCGATLITDQYTAATSCAYCGSPNIIEEQVENDLKPDLVLPFMVERKEAETKFRKWCRGGLLTPADFLKSDVLKAKLQGIYVPFWVYDIQTDASLSANCERRSVKRSGNTEITTIYKYRVDRAGKALFARIPRDASVRMDNEKMDLLEPFDTGKAQTFSSAYLSGYSAERYSETKDQVYVRAEKIASQYAIDELKNTIHGYDSVVVTNSSVDAEAKTIHYALYPIWHYEYEYKGKLYEFMLNGQTGKVVGKPPVSIKRALFVLASSFLSIGLLTLSVMLCM